MAQPAAANNPFATTSCFEYHMTFDRYCLAPTFLAGKYVIDLAKEKQISKAEDLEKLSFTDTLIPRLLLVAQSIVSAVVLPFKLLISIATGLDALINSKDLKAWANFAYSVTNLSAFTLSIPMESSQLSSAQKLFRISLQNSPK